MPPDFAGILSAYGCTALEGGGSMLVHGDTCTVSFDDDDGKNIDFYECQGDDPDCIYIERFGGAANCTGWPDRRGTYDGILYNSTMANGVCSNHSSVIWDLNGQGWYTALFEVASCNEEGVFFKQNCEDSE